MTHTKDLRARVVANTILFLFILQKLKVQVVSHDPTTSQQPLLWWQLGTDYVCSVMYQLMIL